MKKQTSNKQALKEEVRDLLKKSESKEVKSFFIILSYDGKFKIDRYTFSIDPERDERYNFSMDSLTEDEAKSILEGPDTFPVIFQNGIAKDPDWLRKFPGYKIEVPIDANQTIEVEKFFNYEYTPLVFPQIKVSDGHYNYWDHINDPDMKWQTSEERKLWHRVTYLWLKTAEDREEKATGKPVFRASKLYMN